MTRLFQSPVPCAECKSPIAFQSITRNILGTLCLECFQKYQVTSSSATVAIVSKPIENESSGKLGVKADDNKLRYDLVPLTALEGLASILTFGAKKYAPDGWRTVPEGKKRYYSALLRHYKAMRDGEELDPESGLPHKYHFLCNAMFLAELEDK